MNSGWQLKKLDDVCEIVTGGTPKTSVKEYWDGTHLWITPAEMGKRPSPYVSDTERKLTDSGLAECSAKLLPPNSVILSSRAPIGHLVINTEPMATNQGCKGLIPNKALDHKFLFYYLAANVELLNELGTGATFKELSGGKLKEVSITVPPLHEQQRIVAVLDEAFTGIATATDNAKKNLKNAHELFESHLQSIFNTKGDGWVEKKLEKLTTKIGSGATPRGGNDSYKNEGVPLIRSLNVHDRYFKVKELAFIDEAQAKKLDNVVIQKGDVLLNITGASVARCCEAPSEFIPARVNQHVSIIRPIPEVINSAFLTYLLTSKPYKERLLDTGNEAGATRQAITKAQIQNFSVSYPSIPEQQRIVAQLDTLASETKRLEAIYQQKLDNLAALKQSILQKAFAGELQLDRLAA